MNIDTIKVLRGPNQWARFPVLEVRVDLGWLEEYPSHTLAESRVEESKSFTAKELRSPRVCWRDDDTRLERIA